MTVPLRPLAAVSEIAIKALVKEIGVSDTVRFLQQFGNGDSDYTVNRRVLARTATLDDILGETLANETPGSTS